jgi:hypothetical protein
LYGPAGSRPRNKRRAVEVDRNLTLSRPEEEITEDASPFSAVELEHWLLEGGLAVGHDDSANDSRRARTHNHCGWPGIQPTSSSADVGDILYWTTPGAFRYGPIERTPRPQS